MGVSEDALRNWELGKAEPKPRRLPRIAEFLGYEPNTGRYDVTHMISEIRRQTGISYDKLATEIGVCGDTLVNLKNGRYQPTRRTYQRLKTFAAILIT